MTIDTEGHRAFSFLELIDTNATISNAENIASHKNQYSVVVCNCFPEIETFYPAEKFLKQQSQGLKIASGSSLN